MAENTTILNITAKDQTKAAFDSVQANIEKLNRNGVRANNNVDKASRQMRAGFQQAGYQIQDIAVQLQMGTSPFIVLAQQGSQVASIFGAGGALTGAFIAVAAAIGYTMMPALFDSSSALEKLNEAAKELDEITREASNGGVRVLTESFYELAQASSLAAKTQLSDAIRQQRDELANVGGEITKEIDVIAKLLGGGFVDYANLSPGRAKANTEMLAQIWGMDEESVQLIVNSAVSALRTGTDQGIKEFSQTLLQVGDQNEKVTDTFVELRTKINELYSGFITNERTLNENITAIEEFDEVLAKSGVQVTEASDTIENMISKLQYQALTFDMSASQIAVYDGILADANITQLTTIQQLAQEIEARESNAESIKAQAAAEEKLRKERESADEAARRDDERATENMLRREERAVEDSYRRQQEAIETIKKEQTQAMSEPDRIAAEFDERIRNTYDALQHLGLMETEHADLLVRINQEKALAIAEHEKELYDKQMQLTQARFQAAGQLAGALAGVFEEGTAAQRAALAVQKGLAVGEAIMNMHRAISSANAVPWPANALAIAQAASTGLSAIAGIKAASFEGGGFTGYGARAGGIDGRGGMPAIVHPNETIIDHTMGGGAVNVNITIQANDTRGFDELLNKRRGMIASMVQSSLNNMGRSI
jgi:hypothetical protein